MNEFVSHVIPQSEPEEWLRKQHLIRNDKPTVAGVLLFAEVPQAILPKRCAVKLYRYKTTDLVGKRETLAGQPRTLEGSLYRVIYETVRSTQDLIESEHSGNAIEALTYPLETLHEIITNAILHRDYSIADDIHVRVFDNRMEVESPGLLAGHITEKNIYSERFARNGSLVRIINKFPDPPNKDIGEGLRTARDAMEQMRLKAPVLKQRANSVIVYIRHETIASTEATIMDHLEKHETITTSEVKQLCHIDRLDAWKTLAALQKRRLVERMPGTRGATTAYRKLQGADVSLTGRQWDRAVSRGRAKKALDYLKDHGQITAPVLIRMFRIPPVSAHRLLERLAAKNLIERLPGPRNRTAVYLRKKDATAPSLKRS